METELSENASSREPHEHSSSECFELFRHLSEYIDQELDSQACRQIEHHLKDCPACRNCLATLRQTVFLCRSMHDTGIDIPPTASEKLHRAIRKFIASTH